MNILSALSHKNPLHTQVFYLVCAAFFGLMAYPFTQTSAAPYFNAAYGAKYLSLAMISAAALAVVVVIIYNRLAKKIALIPLCIWAIFFIVVVTLFFWVVMGDHPKWMALAYYAWSDVYILILVEQFWSISNTLFTKAEAKRYYGLFLASSAVGGMVGNVIVAKLSASFGSHNMILLCAICLTIFIAFIILLHGSIAENTDLRERFNIEHYLADTSTVGGASLVLKSRYLTLIASLVISTQLYINGTYFIYNRFLDASTKVVESQSAVYAKIFFVIQLFTIFMSLIVTPAALKFIGVAKTHYSIVGTIIAVFGIVLIQPHLAIIAVLFVAAKSVDYSIFRAAKEIFYLPLHVAEKFQAKTFIDVFLYRFSKAIAAFAIILVGDVLGISLFYLIGFGISAWLVLIIAILKIYKRTPSQIDQ